MGLGLGERVGDVGLVRHGDQPVAPLPAAHDRETGPHLGLPDVAGAGGAVAQPHQRVAAANQVALRRPMGEVVQVQGRHHDQQANEHGAQTDRGGVPGPRLDAPDGERPRRTPQRAPQRGELGPEPQLSERHSGGDHEPQQRHPRHQLPSGGGAPATKPEGDEQHRKRQRHRPVLLHRGAQPEAQQRVRLENLADLNVAAVQVAEDRTRGLAQFGHEHHAGGGRRERRQQQGAGEEKPVRGPAPQRDAGQGEARPRRREHEGLQPRRGVVREAPDRRPGVDQHDRHDHERRHAERAPPEGDGGFPVATSGRPERDQGQGGGRENPCGDRSRPHADPRRQHHPQTGRDAAAPAAGIGAQAAKEQGGEGAPPARARWRDGRSSPPSSTR